MKSRNRRFPALLALLSGATVTSLGACPAQAFDLFGGFNNVPSPKQFLNDHALIQAGRGIQSRPSHNPLAGNPNAHWNRARDPGFVSHYDVTRRRPPAYQPESITLTSNAPKAARPAPAPAPTPAPAVKPLLPVASFFDADYRLVWPGESPTGGDLRELKRISDQASLAVLNETKQRGVASITSVAEARQKLLDYGQPALQEIRRDQTLRIADSFHLFMLSLYESLAQAATPATDSPAPATQP